MVAVQEHRSAVCEKREELGDSTRCRMQERNAGTGHQQHSMEDPVMGGQFMAPPTDHRHPYSRLSHLLPSSAFLSCTLHRVEIPHPTPHPASIDRKSVV